MKSPQAELFCRCESHAPELRDLGPGRAAVHSVSSPDKDGVNEDAAALFDLGDGRALLAVADGMGGGPAGERAASTALEALLEAVTTAGEGSLREAILNGVEMANRRVREVGSGAATTLAVVEIDGPLIRCYHVGDSGVLVVGQRGRLKHLTIAHSPTGYGVEAGLIGEDDALHHEERHLVSNVVGTAGMKIEIGPTLRLAPRDSLVLATDGVFDNLRIEEISDAIRVGELEQAAARLAALARERMVAPASDPAPAKPDDCTLVLYRSGERPG